MDEVDVEVEEAVVVVDVDLEVQEWVITLLVHHVRMEVVGMVHMGDPHMSLHLHHTAVVVATVHLHKAHMAEEVEGADTIMAHHQIPMGEHHLHLILTGVVEEGTAHPQLRMVDTHLLRPEAEIHMADHHLLIHTAHHRHYRETVGMADMEVMEDQVVVETEVAMVVKATPTVDDRSERVKHRSTFLGIHSEK